MIGWTEATWNPVTGCSKVSAGCANCYAEAMARRLAAMGMARYRDGFAVRCHEEVLGEPLRWRRPRRVFVNSMSDLFHEEVPAEFIRRIFEVMARCGRHQFQVLTKRSGRLAELAGGLPWPPNVWMGVTVERADCLWRIDDLRRVPAAVRFLSCEPLLGPLEGLDLTGIGWVIVGGESGPRARPVQEEWIDGIHAACQRAGVPFFFKQWSGRDIRKRGPYLHGRRWEEYPADPREAESGTLWEA